MPTLLIFIGIACFIMAHRRRGQLGQKSRPLVISGSICLFFGTILCVVILVHAVIDYLLSPLPHGPHAASIYNVEMV